MTIIRRTKVAIELLNDPVARKKLIKFTLSKSAPLSMKIKGKYKTYEVFTGDPFSTNRSNQLK